MEALKDKKFIAAALIIIIGVVAYVLWKRSSIGFEPGPREAISENDRSNFIHENTGLTFQDNLLSQMGCKTLPEFSKGASGSAVLCTIQGEPLVKIGVYDAIYPEEFLSAAMTVYAYKEVEADSSSFQCIPVNEFPNKTPGATFKHCIFTAKNGGARLAYGLYTVPASEGKNTFILISNATVPAISKKLDEVLAGVAFK